jgi:competence protein ComEC
VWEEEPLAPLDLRLVPAALAAWAGSALGLRGGHLAWWVAAACGLLLAVAAAAGLWRHGDHPAGPRIASTRRDPIGPPGDTVGRRGAVLAGVLAAVTVLGCSTLVAALAVVRAHRDPLVAAGDRGDWAVVDLVTAADPVPVPTRFGGGSAAGDGQDGTGRQPGDPSRAAGSDQRWRIPATAEQATVRGVRWRSAVAVTVFGTGRGWAGLAAGSRFTVSGTVGRDDFSILPGATLQAIGSPVLTRGPPWWLGWAVVARHRLVASAGVLDVDRAGLLRGLVVGDTAGITAQLTDDAKTTGLTHLVAVSGSHVAVVCGLVVVLLRRFGPRVAATGAGMTLVGLILLVGPAPSVLRAALMGAVGVAAVFVGRERAALPALAGTVVLLLLLDPSLALSFGFALSVQATAGLVLFAPGWTRALCRRGVPRGWAQVLVLPVAAQVATAPVIAALSGSVSLVAIPANIAAALVVAPALVVGLLCCAVGPWWAAGGRGLARLDGPLLGWITGVAHRLARMPDATLAWSAGAGGVLALALITAVGLVALRSRWIRLGAMAAACGLLLAVLPMRAASPGWPLAGWLITACEVGQGDGMVLSTGVPQTAVVVDTGPDPGLIDACLDRLGVTVIPMLVLTHLHADHVGGLAGAIEGRRVGTIGVGPDRDPAAAWGDVTVTAAGNGIPVVPLQPGMRWQEGDLTLEVLGPAMPFRGTDSDPNNDSVVMMAIDRGVRILMTGDIEKPAQRDLLDRRADLHADVLKEPHHGSAKILPEFLEAVDPKVSVIGVGPDNDYGQPSPTALNDLAAVGVRTILRTDLDGDAQVGLGPDGLVTAIRGPTLHGSRSAAAGD